MASAALIAGFGAALLVYGPLGTPLRQLSGTTLPVPPTGVVFGNASVAFASQLAGNATWNWTANNTTGGFNGPCNVSGILDYNGTYVPGVNNNSSAQNLSGTGNGTTTVCLNSVNNGVLNATWYNLTNGSQATFNSYNGTDWLPMGSYFNNSIANISACNNWSMYHLLNTTYNSYIPCQTFFEMNNNTTYLTSYTGTGNATGGYNNSTLWSPNQTGYAPNDIIYTIPVIFTNASRNGTYAISIDIEGVTPIAQTFFFNDSIGNTTLANDTVLFAFDMTAAWLVDLSFSGNNGTAPYNTTTMAIYGSIGTVSSIVTECAIGSLGQAVCPIAAPVI